MTLCLQNNNKHFYVTLLAFMGSLAKFCFFCVLEWEGFIFSYPLLAVRKQDFFKHAVRVRNT